MEHIFLVLIVVVCHVVTRVAVLWVLPPPPTHNFNTTIYHNIGPVTLTWCASDAVHVVAIHVTQHIT